MTNAAAAIQSGIQSFSAYAQILEQREDAAAVTALT
jgi:hypothetical protein